MVADVPSGFSLTRPKKLKKNNNNTKDHRYNLTLGLRGKSKLAQDAYEEGHQICRKEAKVL
jgi:hypothetical protein